MPPGLSTPRRLSERFGQREQCRQFDVERHGEPADVREAGVQLSAFDAADVVAMQATAMAEFFLRPATFQADLLDSGSKGEMLR